MLIQHFLQNSGSNRNKGLNPAAFYVLLGLAALHIAFPRAAFAVTYAEISAQELADRIKDPSDHGYVILDIRDETEYNLGYIPFAVNIPLKELGYRYVELDRTKDIIVYCNYGIQSKIACQVLINAGFKDVYNLTGGLTEWTYALVTVNKGVNI